MTNLNAKLRKDEMNEKEKEVFKIYLTREIEAEKVIIKQMEGLGDTSIMRRIIDGKKKECAACTIVLRKLKQTEILGT